MTEYSTSGRLPFSARSRFGVSLPLVAAVLVYAVLIGRGAAMLHDPDTYMHIAIGRWILAHRAVPHTGILSSTVPDAPWVAHEWLGEVVLAGIYDCFGWAGLAAATALCIAAAVAVLLRVLLRRLMPVHAFLAAALAYLLVIPHALARPHIFVLPILVVWTAALVAARSAERAPARWLAVLMVLWANLHGGYIFGLGLVGFFAGEAVLLAANGRTRLAAARDWGVFSVVSLGAALATPFGIDGLMLPFRVAGLD
jgi:hypothetical protein